MMCERQNQKSLFKHTALKTGKTEIRKLEEQS